MHQTKKGNEWYFGMKAHVGVDAKTGMVHRVMTTAANVNDLTEAHRLLYGEEQCVWADAGYQGVEKRAENAGMRIEWRVAMRPSLPRRLDPEGMEALREKRKASVRAKVEHPFLYVKRHFGYAKVRYRGLYKNTQRLASAVWPGQLAQGRGLPSGGMRKAVHPQSPIGGNRPSQGQIRRACRPDCDATAVY